MAAIGLICEGVSEVNMISYIIRRYLGDVDVNTIQPEIVNGKQDSFGGWRQVLNYCNEDKFEQIFATNDFIVIQIDTDTCCEKGYDVDIYDDNHNRISDSTLFARVVDRLKLNLSDIFLQKYNDRIIFAVCINETECWLLPLYYNDDRRCGTDFCIRKLNQELKKQNLNIPDKDKNSVYAQKTYREIFKKIKKKATIQEISQYNFGFKRFVEQLDDIIT